MGIISEFKFDWRLDWIRITVVTKTTKLSYGRTEFAEAKVGVLLKPIRKACVEEAALVLQRLG